MKDILKKLIKECGLGEVIGDITPVSGGLMHKMYRVDTTTGTYAVKCLNPEIMKRPGVMDNYARADNIATYSSGRKAVLPTLTILKRNNAGRRENCSDTFML